MPNRPNDAEKKREAKLLRRRRWIDAFIFVASLATLVSSFYAGLAVIGLDYPDSEKPPLLQGARDEIAMALLPVCFAALISATVWKFRVNAALGDFIHDAETPSRPFFLLLRSFFVDQALTSNPALISAESIMSGLSTVSFFSRLQYTFDPPFAIVKIGTARLLELDGGADYKSSKRWYDRLFSLAKSGAPDSGADEETAERWFDRFLSRAESARFIFMCPIAIGQGGTLREIAALIERDWRAKTAFICPPQSGIWLKPSRGLGWIKMTSQLWAMSQKFLHDELGLSLPRFMRQGGLYLPSETVGEYIAFRGAGGRPWDHPRALRLAFIDGRLRDAPSKDAVRIANSAALVAVVLMFLLGGLAVLDGQTAEQFPAAARIGVGGLVSAFAVLWLASYCGRFGLSAPHRWILVASVLTGLLLGLAIATILFDALGMKEIAHTAWAGALQFVLLIAASYWAGAFALARAVLAIPSARQTWPKPSA